MNLKRLAPCSLLLACVFLFSSLFLPAAVLAEKNDSIHVHLKCGDEFVTDVYVVYKGSRILLEQRSPKLFDIEQPGDIVKPDISEIIVVKTDGSEQVFAPADDYAGVEGNGTINYWLCAEAPQQPTDPAPPTQPDPATPDPTVPNPNTPDPAAPPATPNPNEPAEPVVTPPQPNPGNNNPPAPGSTVDGGELPDTASPWYNILLVSGLLTAVSAIALWKLGKARG